MQVVALAAVCCLCLWNLDTGLRTHAVSVRLANGVVYEVDVHRVYSPGWRQQVQGRGDDGGRELLDVALPPELLRVRRHAGAGASWLTRGKVLLINSGNTVIWWLTDALDGAQAAYAGWADGRRQRSAEENHETIAIDIRRDGVALPLPGEVGDAIFTSVKEQELLFARIPGSAVHHGLYAMDDWFHAEFTDGLEMVIIGKYMLHVVDGRVVRIVGGRGRFDGMRPAP